MCDLCIYVYVYIHENIYTHIYIHICLYSYIYIYIYIFIHIYIYVHMCILKYINIYINLSNSSFNARLVGFIVISLVILLRVDYREKLHKLYVKNEHRAQARKLFRADIHKGDLGISPLCTLCVIINYQPFISIINNIYAFMGYFTSIKYPS
jgi:hypothetical protein